MPTHDLVSSMADYSHRLGCEPDVVIPGEYALWRCGVLNLSVRKDPATNPGTLRHPSWEDPEALAFTLDTDIDGMVWESFNADLQATEIDAQWPNAGYVIPPDKQR